MQYKIICDPTYSAVEVSLQAGERIVGDSGAMAWMSANIKTETTTRGGLLAGMKRKLLSGESFFQNVYYPAGGPGTVTLAPGSAGDICAHELVQGELLLEKGAYLASSEGVTCDAKWDGLRGFFNEGMFVLRVTGTGTLFFHAYGDISPVDVSGEYVVDNGYAVAWEPTLTYQLSARPSHPLVSLLRSAPAAVLRSRPHLAAVAQSTLAGQLGPSIPTGGEQERLACDGTPP